jgi:hypothetical protein
LVAIKCCGGQAAAASKALPEKNMRGARCTAAIRQQLGVSGSAWGVLEPTRLVPPLRVLSAAAAAAIGFGAKANGPRRAAVGLNQVA